MRVCRKINVMVSNPKSTLSYQISDTHRQTYKANLEYKTETKRHGQNEIKPFVSYLQRFETKKKHTNEADIIHMDLPRKEKRRGDCEG